MLQQSNNIVEKPKLMDPFSFCKNECIDKGYQYCSPLDFEHAGTCYKTPLKGD